MALDNFPNQSVPGAEVDDPPKRKPGTVYVPESEVDIATGGNFDAQRERQSWFAEETERLGILRRETDMALKAQDEARYQRLMGEQQVESLAHWTMNVMTGGDPLDFGPASVLDHEFLRQRWGAVMNQRIKSYTAWVNNPEQTTRLEALDTEWKTIANEYRAQNEKILAGFGKALTDEELNQRYMELRPVQIDQARYDAIGKELQELNRFIQANFEGMSIYNHPKYGKMAQALTELVSVSGKGYIDIRKFEQGGEDYVGKGFDKALQSGTEALASGVDAGLQLGTSVIVGTFKGGYDFAKWIAESWTGKEYPEFGVDAHWTIDPATGKPIASGGMKFGLPELMGVVQGAITGEEIKDVMARNRYAMEGMDTIEDGTAQGWANGLSAFVGEIATFGVTAAPFMAAGRAVAVRGTAMLTANATEKTQKLAKFAAQFAGNAAGLGSYHALAHGAPEGYRQAWFEGAMNYPVMAIAGAAGKHATAMLDKVLPAIVSRMLGGAAEGFVFGAGGVAMGQAMFGEQSLEWQLLKDHWNNPTPESSNRFYGYWGEQVLGMLAHKTIFGARGQREFAEQREQQSLAAHEQELIRRSKAIGEREEARIALDRADIIEPESLSRYTPFLRHSFQPVAREVASKMRESAEVAKAMEQRGARYEPTAHPLLGDVKMGAGEQAIFDVPKNIFARLGRFQQRTALTAGMPTAEGKGREMKEQAVVFIRAGDDVFGIPIKGQTRQVDIGPKARALVERLRKEGKLSDEEAAAALRRRHDVLIHTHPTMNTFSLPDMKVELGKWESGSRDPSFVVTPESVFMVTPPNAENRARAIEGVREMSSATRKAPGFEKYNLDALQFLRSGEAKPWMLKYASKEQLERARASMKTMKPWEAAKWLETATDFSPGPRELHPLRRALRGGLKENITEEMAKLGVGVQEMNFSQAQRLWESFMETGEFDLARGEGAARPVEREVASRFEKAFGRKPAEVLLSNKDVAAVEERLEAIRGELAAGDPQAIRNALQQGPLADIFGREALNPIEPTVKNLRKLLDVIGSKWSAWEGELPIPESPRMTQEAYRFGEPQDPHRVAAVTQEVLERHMLAAKEDVAFEVLETGVPGSRSVEVRFHGEPSPKAVEAFGAAQAELRERLGARAPRFGSEAAEGSLEASLENAGDFSRDQPAMSPEVSGKLGRMEAQADRTLFEVDLEAQGGRQRELLEMPRLERQLAIVQDNIKKLLGIRERAGDPQRQESELRALRIMEKEAQRRLDLQYRPSDPTREVERQTKMLDVFEEMIQRAEMAGDREMALELRRQQLEMAKDVDEFHAREVPSDPTQEGRSAEDRKVQELENLRVKMARLRRAQEEFRERMETFDEGEVEMSERRHQYQRMEKRFESLREKETQISEQIRHGRIPPLRVSPERDIPSDPTGKEPLDRETSQVVLDKMFEMQASQWDQGQNMKSTWAKAKSAARAVGDRFGRYFTDKEYREELAHKLQSIGYRWKFLKLGKDEEMALAQTDRVRTEIRNAPDLVRRDRAAMFRELLDDGTLTPADRRQLINQTLEYAVLRDLAANYLRTEYRDTGEKDSEGKPIMEEVQVETKLPGNVSIEAIHDRMERMQRLPEFDRINTAFEQIRGILDEAYSSMVERGIASEKSRRPDYFPREISDWADVFDAMGPSVRGEVKQPVRGYLKQRLGSERLIDSSLDVLTDYLTKVRVQNAIHDYMHTVSARSQERILQAEGLDLEAIKAMEPEEWRELYDGLDKKGLVVIDLAWGHAGHRYLERDPVVQKAIADITAATGEPLMPEAAIGRYFRPDPDQGRYLTSKEMLLFLRESRMPSKWNRMPWLYQVNRMVGKWFKGPALRGLGGLAMAKRVPRNLLSDATGIWMKSEDGTRALLDTLKLLPEAHAIAKAHAKQDYSKLTAYQQSIREEMETFGTIQRQVRGAEGMESGTPEAREWLRQVMPETTNWVDKISRMARADFRWAQMVDDYSENLFRIAYFMRERMGRFTELDPEKNITRTEDAHIKAGEVLVNYNQLTPGERLALNGLVFPFYTWAKGNFLRIGAETVRGGLQELHKSPAAKWAVFAGTLGIWNYIMARDEEERLWDVNPTMASRPHLILPYFRDEYGSPFVISFEDTYIEAAKMMGMDHLFTDLTQYALHHGNEKELAKNVTIDVVDSAKKSFTNWIAPWIRGVMKPGYQSKFETLGERAETTFSGDLITAFRPAADLRVLANIGRQDRSAGERWLKYAPFVGFMDISEGVPAKQMDTERIAGTIQRQSSQMTSTITANLDRFVAGLRAGDRAQMLTAVDRVWGDVGEDLQKVGVTKANVIARMLRAAERRLERERVIESGGFISPRFFQLTKTQQVEVLRQYLESK